MEIKDFSDAIIKVASINNDRIKAWSCMIKYDVY